jgi:hypothetical protein
MELKFLELARFRASPPAVSVFEGPAQVRAYWEGLRSGGSIPGRWALDPRGMTGVLDRVFVAERIGRGVAQVRIAGSALGEIGGMDLRGLPLTCLFCAEARDLVGQVLEQVLLEPAVAELDLVSDRGNGDVIAQLVLMPLADDQDRKLVLGAFGFAPGASRRCKFKVARRREERLFPRAMAPTPSPAPTGRRFGHLTLVHAKD